MIWHIKLANILSLAIAQEYMSQNLTKGSEHLISFRDKPWQATFEKEVEHSVTEFYIFDQWGAGEELNFTPDWLKYNLKIELTECTSWHFSQFCEFNVVGQWDCEKHDSNVTAGSRGRSSSILTSNAYLSRYFRLHSMPHYWNLRVQEQWIKSTLSLPSCLWHAPRWSTPG